MKIANGGTVLNLVSAKELSKKIETIRVEAVEKHKFELWINDDSLSYLNINEVLALKDEIQEALHKSILMR